VHRHCRCAQGANPACKTKLESAEKLLRSRIAEREQIASRLVAFEKNRDSIRGQLALVLREIETRRVRQDVLQRELASLADRETELARQREVISGKLEQANEELSRVEDERQGFETKWRALSEKVIQIRESMASSTAELNKLQQDKDELRSRFENRRRETLEIDVRLTALNEQVADLQRELAETRQALHENAQKQSLSQAACKALEQQVHETKVLLAEHFWPKLLASRTFVSCTCCSRALQAAWLKLCFCAFS